MALARPGSTRRNYDVSRVAGFVFSNELAARIVLSAAVSRPRWYGPLCGQGAGHSSSLRPGFGFIEASWKRHGGGMMKKKSDCST
jgi:hypothetical protein